MLKDTLNNSEHNQDNKTQIINSDFYEEVYSLTDFFNEGDIPLEKIRPYLNEEFESIFVLSEYVRKLLNIANHHFAQGTKSDISIEYGSKGRKLCNLYLRGYINKVIEEYAYSWINSKDLSENEKSRKINSLIEDVLRNADSIFFIYPAKSGNFLNEISKKINYKSDFIAIHAGGKMNIGTLNKILSSIEKKENYKFYDVKKNRYYDTKAKCYLLDVYMRLLK